jgi:hypothetical protein
MRSEPPRRAACSPLVRSRSRLEGPASGPHASTRRFAPAVRPSLARRRPASPRLGSAALVRSCPATVPCCGWTLPGRLQRPRQLFVRPGDEKGKWIALVLPRKDTPSSCGGWRTLETRGDGAPRGQDCGARDTYRQSPDRPSRGTVSSNVLRLREAMPDPATTHVSGPAIGNIRARCVAASA